MSSFVFILLTFLVTSFILSLVYFLFIRKSKGKNLVSLIAPSDYKPNGKVGYARVNIHDFQGVIIVEEIDRISNGKNGSSNKSMVKIKILEVTIDLDCDCTQEDILEKWGRNIWCNPSYITWHEKTAGEKREEKIDGLVGNNKKSP